MSRNEATVLADLYNGKIAPYARDRSAQYNEVYQQFQEKRKAFCAKLPTDLMDEFDKLMDEHTDLLAIDGEDDFIEGFKLGVRIMEQVQEDY